MNFIGHLHHFYLYQVFLRQPIIVEDLDTTCQYFWLLNESDYIPDMYCKNFETYDDVEKELNHHLVLSGKKHEMKS